MSISRRDLFRRFSAGALSAAAGQSVRGLSLAEVLRPPRGTRQPGQPILLDHNENAYGPSEKVLAVLREAPSLSNRYPRTDYELLRGKLVALHAIKDEQLLLGCGSSEILRLAAGALLGPGKRLIQAVPTYPALAGFARSAGAEVVDVPLTKRFEHDLEAMLAGARNSAGLVYICNPNNPTGTLTPRSDIESFIRKLPENFTILIDEAYCHFVKPHLGYSSFLDVFFNDPRLIVCRTFSKVYGLAGMRVGYAVGEPEVLRRLSASQLRYGTTVISARAAASAVDDVGYVRLAIKRNSDDRQEFMNAVNTRMLRALDSHANFTMMDPLRPVDMVLDHLKKNNVLVAPRIPAMEKYFRVSFGTPEEMQEFWRVMDLLPPTGKMAM